MGIIVQQLNIIEQWVATPQGQGFVLGVVAAAVAFVAVKVVLFIIDAKRNYDRISVFLDRQKGGL